MVGTEGQPSAPRIQQLTAEQCIEKFLAASAELRELKGEKDTFEGSQDDIKKILEKHGLRVTPATITSLQVEAKNPSSEEDIKYRGAFLSEMNFKNPDGSYAREVE